MSSDRPMTIGMVAGEASGDNLGSALVREILKLTPNTKFVGMGGPAMIAEDFTSEFEMERLSVNGFVDPLLRLPELYKMLVTIRDRVIDSGADCFVGIDSNFFNLMLAGMLKKRGIRTVHYVSPTVWAWRQGRVRKIARRIDLMMTLYPFETEIYENNGIPVVYVGHPKADEIKPDHSGLEKSACRKLFGIADTDIVVAILPGSRSSEVRMTGDDFLRTAKLIAGDVDQFVIPAANQKRLAQLQEMLARYPELQGKVLLVEGQSRQVMTAADVVLVNSGTATLEAMLLRRPMVMSYRLGGLSYAIVSRLVKTNRFALPNILADKDIVPEFVQDEAEPVAMAEAIRKLLTPPGTAGLMKEFDAIHQLLTRDAEPGSLAARAVLNLCGVKI
jgi:lipid-A-disaccharide synthase